MHLSSLFDFFPEQPLLLKEKPLSAADVCEEEKSEEDQSSGSGSNILCAACQAFICSSGSRRTVSGSFEHIQANPAGVVYRIGCFSRAPGCILVGTPSGYWSWFKGYNWQIEVCRQCSSHLGWLFTSAESSFHGLILDNLVEEEGLERDPKA